MRLHFINSYSIFSASPGSYDFYRPEVFIPVEKSRDVESEDLGQVLPLSIADKEGPEIYKSQGTPLVSKSM